MRLLLVGSIVTVVWSDQTLGQANFESLQFRDGYFTTPRALTPDGGTVIGDSGVPFGSVSDVWRWQSSTGFQDLTGSFGSPPMSIAAASSTGGVVVGTQLVVVNEQLTDIASRWTAQSGVQSIGLLPGGTSSFASGVSGDGVVVVGSANRVESAQSFSRAFRWTAETGMVELAPLANNLRSRANSISRNGMIVVGSSNDDVNNPNSFRAVRWLTDGQPHVLGAIPNSGSSFASAVSADGSVVAGNITVNPGANQRSHAFRWMAGTGMVDLGFPVGGNSSSTLAINGDGSVVVGEGSGFNDGDTRATMWTAELGMVDLNTYLPTLGIDLTNWLLSRTIGVSDDGRTLAGWGTFDDVPGPGGAIGRGWVVTIPAPSSLPVAVMCGSVLFSRRHRNRRNCCRWR